MSIYGQITGGFWSEHGIGGAILHEIAGHPVILPAGEVLHRFAKEMAVQLCAAFAG